MRAAAYFVGLGTLLLVVLPGFGDPARDSYPLSTYPMFARQRTRPTLFFAEGLDEQGRPTRLPPELVAGQEVMQAAVTVRRAARAGEPALERLCGTIAARAAEDTRYAALRAIALVRARFDPVRYFSEDPRPEERATIFQCAVPRGSR